MPVDEDFQYDVFISYSRQDEAFVDFLKRCLELAGQRCFRDTTDLSIYDKLDAALKRAVSQSRWLMAVISPAYLQSYWCLFEALEVIQGQDLTLRFLPVVLRNSDQDQLLDENFVLQALGAIREEMSVFQAKMIAEKAFGLAPKLEKLAFVQSQLPKVFSQLGQRVYPQFDLWDEANVRKMMREVLKRVAPDSVVDLNAVKFGVRPGQATPTVIPRLNSLPVLVWKAEIGCQAWKNNVVAAGNDVLVTSSGRTWNEPDEMDGIYCLHGETGKTRWFLNTPADANRLMVSKGLALAGCDDGSVVAVGLQDGVRRWQVQLDSAVVGGPFRLPANVADGLAIGQRNATEPVLVVTYEGNLHILDQVSGRTVRSLSLGTPFIGAPVLLPGGRGVVVSSRDGRVHLINYSDISIAFGNTRALTIAGRDLDENPSNATASVEFAAQPVLAGNLILQGLVRDTYYDDPPLVAIDSRTMNLQWVARAPPDPKGFGNLRGAPAIVGQEAILAPAYYTGLCAVSLQTGKTNWSIDLSQEMFEQRSAPVVMGRSIFIGRHDGYLHKVSCERRRREWSLYLGEHAQAGTVVAGSQTAPEFSDSSAWAAGGSSPILATPTLDRGRLYVGTHEGWLYCISNLGGDDPDF
jgi:outer membrane protein assembly factor BamB